VAVPPAPDGTAGVTSSDPHEPPRSPAFRLALLGVLVVLLLASAGALIWLVADRQGEADDLQADREAVMAQTEQFMLRMGTFGPDLLDEQGAMPEYRERVKEVITPKFATSFDQEAVTAEQLVAQAQVAREAKVFATGVSVIDADSATALVAGSFTDTYPQGKKGERLAAQPVPFRIEVTLVKSEGEWLVDDFNPVTGGPQ
jgi:Mce-associated membrane protein